MSYTDYSTAYTRSSIDIVKITLDYCSNTFGTAPCTATGTECYNTITTCKDKANYTKGSKDYLFTNCDKKLIANGYLPYIKSIDLSPTEVSEEKTIVGRLKLQMSDDLDYDTMTDPYWSERGYANFEAAKGKFFLRLLARNLNYKGRTVVYTQGFSGLALNQFETRFTGIIDNITYNNGTITIDVVDKLKSLADIDYPIPTSHYVFSRMPMFDIVENDTKMNALEAKSGDYCVRTDYDLLAEGGDVIYTVNTGGGLSQRSKKYLIAGKNQYGDYVALSDTTRWDTWQVLYFNQKMTIDTYNISPSFLTEILIFHQTLGDSTLYCQVITPGDTWEDVGAGYSTATETIPETAYRLFKFTTAWAEIEDNDMAVTVNAYDEFPSSGYITIGEEMIYYAGKATFGGEYWLHTIKRAMLRTTAKRHPVNTAINIVLSYDNDNPYSILKDMLTTAYGSSSIYSTNFTTLESAYTGLNFQLKPFAKTMKLSQLYFDAVNMLDCISWVNEDGKIDIKKIDNSGATYTAISDNDIIAKSFSLDQKEKERYSRYIVYWNYNNVGGDPSSCEYYYHRTIEVDADAEGANEYNEISKKIIKTLFLYSDNTMISGTGDSGTYLNDLLDLKLTRNRDPKEVVNLAVELRNSGVKIGDFIKLTTDELCDITGAGIYERIYIVTKKEYSENKIKLTLKRY